MSESVLEISREDGVTTLTLNRPRVMNALSGELRAALASAFRELAGDDATEVAILTGKGRAFCAGLDLRELGARQGRSAVGGDGRGRDEDVLGAIERFDRPLIGAINGVAVTGGFELALACDLLIGCPETRFADTHARVGILPGWGLSQKLSRAVGVYRAKELSLTGNYLDAEQACEWGLLNRIVPREALLDTARALARDMQECVPEVMREYKRLIDRGHAVALGEGLALEAETARERNRAVTPADVEARRRAIQARGRRQSRP